MVPRAALALGAALLFLGSASPSGDASPRAERPRVSAQAFAVRIVLPAQAPVGTPAVTAPPDTVSLEGAFSYPADGSIVTTSATTASASTALGVTSSGRGSSDVTSLSVFRGEITATRVTARARAGASARGVSAGTSGSGVSGLLVFGQPVASGRVALGDWGSLEVLGRSVSRNEERRRNSSRASVTVLSVRLTADHGGLPAGSEIVVGYAEAAAELELAQPPPPPTSAEPSPPPPPRADRPPPGRSRPAARAKPKLRKPPEPARPTFGTPPVRRAPPRVTPRLTAGPYVFPVYGLSWFTDTFGAPRASVGWHHGADIFAPLGTPVLAVARGTVFSVGWNDVGGNRLWLQDEQGNEFYYAHLSGFSPLAVNGANVKAGDVLGFVGNTGDATGTPYHLHFEIHPVGLLGRGYDGAVNPTTYLVSWERVQDLNLVGAVPVGVAPKVVASAAAPRPGAILLQMSDISDASALQPESLRIALADAARREGDGAFLRMTRASLTRG